MPNTFGDPVLWLEELMTEGIFPYKDAKQIIAGTIQTAFSSSSLIAAVKAGAIDVAFVRSNSPFMTGQLDKSLKTVGTKNITVPGTQAAYPFPISTSLYPESALAAFPSVPSEVRFSVMKALLRLNQSSPPVVLGGYARWDPPASYDVARQAAEDSGLLMIDPRTRQRMCRFFLPTFADYDLVVCPPPLFRVPELVAAANCHGANLSCIGVYKCWCVIMRGHRRQHDTRK
jgi:hypothetical protein